MNSLGLGSVSLANLKIWKVIPDFYLRASYLANIITLPKSDMTKFNNHQNIDQHLMIMYYLEIEFVEKQTKKKICHDLFELWSS